jgi:hypothetical protein
MAGVFTWRYGRVLRIAFAFGRAAVPVRPAGRLARHSE